MKIALIVIGILIWAVDVVVLWCCCAVNKRK